MKVVESLDWPMLSKLWSGAIRNRQSAIGHLQSATRIPQPAVPDPEASILNPQSSISVPKVVLVETPRDAFQGIRDLIPTAEKIAHITRLIDAGCRCIDFGSFVSPKAVPQMRDSEAVLEAIGRHPSLTLIAIIANQRGLDRAIATGKVDAVGFPFSISDTFQMRNTHKSIEETWPIVEDLARCSESQRIAFILYLSMAFGNPYGDSWSARAVIDFVRRLDDLGVRVVSLADTTAEANPAQISELAGRCRSEFPDLELGIHLHSDASGWPAKLTAALECGIQRVDSAVAGMGGCPFARKELVGNIPTEGVVDLLESRGIPTGIDRVKLLSCVESARHIMELYGTASC
ncbi:MAG TPA: hydroxymethylglutaryl-CoA lyase [Acidobacteriota bacterium]|jgi:hydroxymethylglutaryl-CoA lyase